MTAIKTHCLPYSWSRFTRNFKALRVSAFSIIMMMGLFIQTANAQDPCPGSNCVSGDIRITKVTLVQNDLNYSALPNSCTPGQTNVPVALKVDFDVTSQTRYGFIVTADVYINGTKSGKIAKCYTGTFAQGARTRYVDVYVTNAAINWPCGSTIQLRNVYTAWDNQAPSKSNPSICTYLNTTCL